MNARLLSVAGAVTAWLGFGLISSGGEIAYFKGQYCDYYKDRATAEIDAREAYAFAITGPIGAVSTAISTGFYYYGWTLSQAPTKDCPQ